MAITSGITHSPTHANRAVGSFIDTGTVKQSAFRLGFVPRYIKLVNATDRISYEWFEGMAAGYVLKTAAAGAATLETSGGISTGELDTGAADAWTVYGPTTAAATDNSALNTAGERVEGFSVPAALVPTNKQFYLLALD